MKISISVEQTKKEICQYEHFLFINGHPKHIKGMLKLKIKQMPQ